MPKKTSIGLQFGGSAAESASQSGNSRQRAQDLDQPLDDVVDPAADVAGEAAEDQAEHERHGDADEADRERDARPVDDAREQVAPEPVRAEQEERAVLGRTDEVEVRRRHAPERDRRSPRQKKRIGCGVVRSTT